MKIAFAGKGGTGKTSRTAWSTSRRDVLKAELERHLAAARDQQNRLSELLATAPAARPVAGS